MVYDAVKDLLRRAPDRKGGAGRTEQLTDSPSFIVSGSSTPSQPQPAPPQQPPIISQAPPAHQASSSTSLQPP